MAIVLISQPSATPGAVSDYQAQNTLIGLLAQRGNVVQFADNEVKAGTFFNIGGAIFSSTSDTAISGTPTNYVKLTVSGSNATASYVALPGNLTFNETYNGYYSGSDLILFDEEAAAFRGDIGAVRFSESRYTTAARILERLLTVDSDTSGLNAQYLGGMDKDRFLQLAANGLAVRITDANAPTRTGIYMGYETDNAPTAGWYFIEHYHHSQTNQWSRQIAYAFETDGDVWQNSYTRQRIGEIWTPWAKQWNSANDGADSGLDADLHKGGGGLATRNTVTLTGSGNWTVPATINRVRVRMIGGGGGGGGGNSSGSGGGGGGASGESVDINYTVTPGAVLAYSCGAGGAGGAANTSGVAGDDTTFSGITVQGGEGGGSTSKLGAGGFNSGGLLAIDSGSFPGQTGGPVAGGSGGGKGGGQGAYAIGFPPTTLIVNGAGGGGGRAYTVTSDACMRGANGRAGQIVLCW